MVRFCSVLREIRRENKDVEGEIEKMYAKIKTGFKNINSAFKALMKAIIECPEKFEIGCDDVVDAARHCRESVNHSTNVDISNHY